MPIRKTLTIAAIVAIGAGIQTNHPPMVKIELLAGHTTIPINSPGPYQVHVSDQEDGDSRYDEINTKEVLLELALQGPAGKAANPAPQAPAPSIDPALTIMATNNCYNCHLFNGRSLGPSFYEIAKRYAFSPANTDTLTRRVKDGSSGTWGR